MALFFILIIVALLVLFAIMPSLRRHTDRGLINGGMFAHRGFFDNNKGIPENSLSAFSEAVARGYGIELDLRLTADGEVVVFHDENLERMCGVNKKVCELTLSQLRELSLMGTGDRISTFKEALSLIEGRVPLIIEYKCEGANCDELCENSVKLLSDYTGRYVIESFNPMVLKWFKKNRPSVMRGQLAMGYRGREPVKLVVSLFLLNFLARPDFIAYDEAEKDRIAFKLQRLLGGFPVGWTFKTNKRLLECKNDFKAYIFEGFSPKKVKED